MELSECLERVEVESGYACRLVETLSEKPLELCTVGEDACRYCCQQEHRPTPEVPNVVITSSLVHTAQRAGDEALIDTAKKLHQQTQNGLFKKAEDYLQARKKWAGAGKPMRSDERIAEVFQICESCPHIIPNTQDEGGQCGICGCWLYPQVGLVNKIQWATEKCPLSPPKWDAEEGTYAGTSRNASIPEENQNKSGELFDYLRQRKQARVTVSGVKPLNQKEILRLNTVWVVQESMRDEGRGILVLEKRVDPPVGGIVILQMAVKKSPSGPDIVQVGFMGALEIKFRVQQSLDGRKFLLSVHKDDYVRDLDLSRASIRVEIL
jgi:hypothetical protein